MNVYEKLAIKYPQILIPIEKDICHSELYKNICLRGEETDLKPEFIGDEKDALEVINTPAGNIEVLTVGKREDFVHAVRSLGNRCEPVEVPDSTGAIAIFGLNNWEKVRADLDDYKDSILILSTGDYSNVTVDQVNSVTNNELNLSKDEWIEKSILIRKYHELTHFVMRKLYPDDIDYIRDELIADMVGLVGAFKTFDPRLERLFLGIESDVYRKGGRLENYEGGSVENIPSIQKNIDKLEALIKGYDSVDDVWDNIKKFM